MDREQLHKLIEEVTGEVGLRLERKQGGRRRCGERVVLLPAPAAFPRELQECLLRRYSGGWTTVDLTGGGDLPPEQLDRQHLQELVSQAEVVALAVPPIALLREIAAGEDGSDLAYLVIRAILWGKKVELLLDFDPPKFRRNSFLGQVAEAVDTLRSMEVEVVNYRLSRPRQALMDLVTEEAVREAARTRERALWCEKGAIITPSARDAIRELGVEIRYEKE